jgi:Tfp pilus assembly protein PilO
MDFLRKIGDIKAALQGNPRALLRAAIGIGIALIALIIGTQILLTTQTKVSKLTQEIADESKHNILLESIHRLQMRLEERQKHLLPTLESAWLMNRLTQLTASMGLTLLSIQPEKFPASEKLQGVSIGMALNCSYHQLGQLVEKIENSDIFMRIQELNMEKAVTEETTQGDVTTRTGKGRVQMIIHSFRLNEK